MHKPFRPPLLLKRPLETGERNKPKESSDTALPTKKRKISTDCENEPTPRPRASSTKRTTIGTFVAPRKVLGVVQNASSVMTSYPGGSNGGGIEGFYTVLWRKFTTKKNKTWDGDGVLSVRAGVAVLQDIDGRDMGKVGCQRPLLPGSTISVGGKDVEVDSVISKADFLAGKPFLGGVVPAKAKPVFNTQSKNTAKARHQSIVSSSPQDIGSKPRPTISVAHYKNPLVNKPSAPTISLPKNVPRPRHDPHAPGALVMKRPAKVPAGKQLVDVVVDPLLTRHLRPHQRHGVQFLYECVMGLREYSGEGAILADEMGLGKTLQTIALLWTLLKQNPVYEGSPPVKKALIVCPVTLIDNWRKEFRKWLGPDRIGVFVLEDKKTRLSDFTMGKIYSVMIVGYEKLRLIQDDLKKGAPIDIVVADEGHRLKTAQNKSALAIRGLNTERRVILSGTPIQNDLGEFFTMVDFVNPGLLSKYNTFRREFENPILKSRQPDATETDIEKGEARSEELASITSQFILRRTTEVIAKFLPPKTEVVLFCRPTSAQANIYKAILKSPAFAAVLGSFEASLQLITLLKKVCNSPSLLVKASKKGASSDEAISPLIESVDPALFKFSPSSSAKIQVLDALLHQIRSNTSEKVVIVSNYTSTLDVLGSWFESRNYPYLRLDGKTPASNRQQLVDKFNGQPSNKCFAFLLSAKAGGTGLNLVGASRLVLFDSDWNPATDLQAMARIHRDGQKLPCFIYRILVQGAMDEKIFQRQVAKTGLADAVVDAKKTTQGFSREELRDLFRLDEGTACQTHELLGCKCQGRGSMEHLVEDDDESGRTFGVSMDDSAADSQSDSDAETGAQIGTLVQASEVDKEKQERHIRNAAQRRRRRKSGDKSPTKSVSLMQFLHVDAEAVREGDEKLQALIADQMLLETVKDKASRVAYVFARTTG